MKTKRLLISFFLSFILMISSTSIFASADSNTMVLDFYVNNSYLYKNGFPAGVDNHLNTAFNKAKASYLAVGISLKKKAFTMNGTHILSTRDEDCPSFSSSNYKAGCSCVNNSICYAGSGFHHTNIDYIRSHSLPNGSASTKINVLLTGNKICRCDHTSPNSYVHTGQNEYYGRAYTNNYSIIIRDMDLVSNNTSYSLLGSTMAHEIAHLYGLNHHYTNVTINQNCLYGINKWSYNLVVNTPPNNWFCSTCKAELSSNKSLFNQSL